MLHYDPARDAHKLFPLLIVVGNSAATATEDALAQRLAALDKVAVAAVQGRQRDYRAFLAGHIRIEIEMVDPSRIEG